MKNIISAIAVITVRCVYILSMDLLSEIKELLLLLLYRYVSAWYGLGIDMRFGGVFDF
jgi:hypothetical protein